MNLKQKKNKMKLTVNTNKIKTKQYIEYVLCGKS